MWICVLSSSSPLQSCIIDRKIINVFYYLVNNLIIIISQFFTLQYMINLGSYVVIRLVVLLGGWHTKALQ